MSKQNDRIEKEAEIVRNDIENFFSRKDIHLGILDTLVSSYLMGNDIYEELKALDNSDVPDLRLVFNLLLKDKKLLSKFFKTAKIPEDKIKKLLDIKKKYEILTNPATICRYSEDTGSINRWSGFSHKSTFNHVEKKPMLEIEIESINQRIFYTNDDALSIYRLGSLLQYIVREELKEHADENMVFDDEFILNLKQEMKKNVEEHHRLDDLLKKIKTIKSE